MTLNIVKLKKLCIKPKVQRRQGNQRHYNMHVKHDIVRNIYIKSIIRGFCIKHIKLFYIVLLNNMMLNVMISIE